MSRPTDKSSLLAVSEGNFQKLLQQIHDLENPDFHFPENMLNRNVRDVLAHLHQWHLMLLDWYNVGMTGEKPQIPAPGYTWKTLPDLNRKIRDQYDNLALETAMEKLKDSHEKVMNLIRKHSSEALFEKKRYGWTGTTSLGAYLISSTSSHYDWAFKLIRRAERQKKANT